MAGFVELLESIKGDMKLKMFYLQEQCLMDDRLDLSGYKRLGGIYTGYKECLDIIEEKVREFEYDDTR